jgi:hypothetical protein
MPGYPGDAVPGAGLGEGIPPASFQDSGYQDSGYEEGGFPDSAPETYRPGQQP